jgi:hypothetical protein
MTNFAHNNPHRLYSNYSTLTLEVEQLAYLDMLYLVVLDIRASNLRISTQMTSKDIPSI